MKVLIVRFSSIGDIVLTSPVVRCLKLQNNCTIHFLTKNSFASVLEANIHIDKIWTYDKENYAELVKLLRDEHFDYIIDLHNNLRSRSLSWRLGVKTYRFPKLNIQKWLLTNFKFNQLPKDLHIVDRYMKAVEPLGVRNDNQGLDYFIPETALADMPKLPQVYIVLVVGAAHATKAIPLPKIKELIGFLHTPVVLIGGKNEQESGSELAKAFPDKAINLCGLLSIHSSAGIIQNAAIIISPDTGMMHIAAALKKPLITVWGNTVRDFGMYPYYPANKILDQYFEVKDLPCRPCSKIGYAECPKKHFNCMMGQDMEKIADAVNDRLI